MHIRRTVLLLAAAAAVVPTAASAQYTGSTMFGDKGVVTLQPGGTYQSTATSTTHGKVREVRVGYDNMIGDDPTGTVVTITHGGVTVTVLRNRCIAKTVGKWTAYDAATISQESYPTQNVCKQGSTDDQYFFKSAEPLSAFVGMDSYGPWTVTVTNSAATSMRFGQAYVTASTVAPDWAVGDWSDWSQTCGSATRTRDVYCMSSGNERISDGFCTGTKPTNYERSTQTTGCSYAWQTGAWTTTGGAAGCGPTTRTRTVKCVQTTATGTVDQPDTSCTGTAKPTISESITDYSSCRYGWYQTGYQLSACEASAQTYRTSFSCFRSDGSLAAGACGYTPPSRSMTQSCAYWQANSTRDFGYAEPSRPLVPSEYSPAGVANGVGFVSKTADTGTIGYQGPYWSGIAPIARTGGVYDPARDVYTLSEGTRYTGGAYDSTNGAYYGGTSMQAEGGQGDGSPVTTPKVGDVVMRRPLGDRF